MARVNEAAAKNKGPAAATKPRWEEAAQLQPEVQTHGELQIKTLPEAPSMPAPPQSRISSVPIPAGFHGAIEVQRAWGQQGASSDCAQPQYATEQAAWLQMRGHSKMAAPPGPSPGPPEARPTTAHAYHEKQERGPEDDAMARLANAGMEALAEAQWEVRQREKAEKVQIEQATLCEHAKTAQAQALYHQQVQSMMYAQVLQLREANGWQMPHFPAHLDYNQQLQQQAQVQQVQAVQAVQQIQAAAAASAVRQQVLQQTQQSVPQLFPRGFRPFSPVSHTQAAEGKTTQIPTVRARVASSNTSSKNVVYKGMVLLIEDDGYEWRKYGQKELKESIVRHYFKCKNKECQAKKCLDQTQHHPIKTDVTYVGAHTCRDDTDSDTEMAPPSPGAT